MINQTIEDLKSRMFEKYGPTITGDDLYQMVGFETYEAFHRAKKLNQFSLKVFKLENRRGWYALTEELAEWIYNQANKSNLEVKNEQIN